MSSSSLSPSPSTVGTSSKLHDSPSGGGGGGSGISGGGKEDSDHGGRSNSNSNSNGNRNGNGNGDGDGDGEKKSKPKKPNHKTVDFMIKSAIAGGFAGGLAKTAIAPLERVKILFQTSHKDYIKYSASWRGIPLSLRQIFQTQGVRAGLYRGHSLTLARTIPHAAIGYAAYEQARAYLMPSDEYKTAGRRFLCGTISGCASLPFTYPFELIRVRMAFDIQNQSSSTTSNGSKLTTSPTKNSVFRAIANIWKEGVIPPSPTVLDTAAAGSTTMGSQLASVRSSNGSSFPTSPSTTISSTSHPPPPRPHHQWFGHPLTQFYRGFSVSLVGAVPYRGSIFLIWETLNTWCDKKVDQLEKRDKISGNKGTRDGLRTTQHFVVGAIAGALAQIGTYPLEVVRRRQQVGGSRNPSHMLGFMETVRTVWREGKEGYRDGRWDHSTRNRTTTATEGTTTTTGKPNLWKLMRGGPWRSFYVGLGLGLVKQVPMHSLSLTTFQLAKGVLGIDG